jgi:hypothetical protein
VFYLFLHYSISFIVLVYLLIKSRNLALLNFPLVLQQSGTNEIFPCHTISENVQFYYYFRKYLYSNFIPYFPRFFESFFPLPISLFFIFPVLA